MPSEFLKIVKKTLVNCRFFLSRPRGFGKSVFLSTLKEILLGKKELFEELWIAERDYKWPFYGVIHLDFSRTKSLNTATVEESICLNLANIATGYGLSLSLSTTHPN